ncbi:TPA: hypothetical protein ACFNOV_000617, partial [Neisseria meningitidis]
IPTTFRFRILAFAGMTAAGCCFLFINFCNFEFQPSSINYSGLTKISTALPRLSSKRTIL